MTDFPGIDPDDIQELEARSKKIVQDSETYYEVTMMVSHTSALEFLERYQRAVDGDVMSLFALMTVIHAIATNFQVAMDSDYGDDDEGL
jgi:hypothetical protein